MSNQADYFSFEQFLEVQNATLFTHNTPNITLYNEELEELEMGEPVFQSSESNIKDLAEVDGHFDLSSFMFDAIPESYVWDHTQLPEKDSLQSTESPEVPLRDKRNSTGSMTSSDSIKWHNSAKPVRPHLQSQIITFHASQETFVKARIFDHSDVTGKRHSLNLNVAKLDARAVSASVRNTIQKEFRLQDQCLEELENANRKVTKRKIRKRRNPSCDSLVWQPVSIYQAAYTNIRISPLDKTDYHLHIPPQSCFGKINMRAKRAWMRGPNRETK